MPRPSDPSEQPRRRPVMAGRDGITTSHANVRLAVGLAHGVPGAELRIRRTDGGELVAANRPDADVDLCSLRRLVIGTVGASTADRWIEVIGVGGSVTATDDGLWASNDAEPRRWFATMLRQERVIDLLGEIDTADIGDDGIEVVLKPDPCLGLTSIGVSAEGPHLVDRLDELARRANVACLVDELIWSARAAVPRVDPPRSRTTPVDLNDASKGENP
ncbi:MAG: hypothetical protein AAGA93_26525 [Actinomycetota bacterium]